MSTKSLKISAAIFIICFISAAIFMVKGKSTPKNLNPLYLHDIDDITRVEFQDQGQEILLEKKEGFWVLTKPFEDWAGQHILENFLNKIVVLSIESVVSENKSKFSEFGLSEEDQIRLSIFRNSPPDLVFSGYFGKQALGYGTLYFRFDGEEKVRLAYEIQDYILKRDAQNYRMRELLPFKFEDLESIEYISNGKTIKASRKNKDEWLNNKGEVVSQKFVNDLKAGFNRLTVAEFVLKQGQDVKRGLDPAQFQIKAQGAGKSVAVSFGNNLPPKPNDEAKTRYAQTEGRASILIVNDLDIDDFKQKLTLLQEAPAGAAPKPVVSPAP